MIRIAALALLLPLALAGCTTTEDATVTFPTFAGKRVIYTADVDADDSSAIGDEVWVADTGSLTQAVTLIDAIGLNYYFDRPGGVGTAGPFVWRAINDPTDGCPSEFHLLARAGGTVTTPFTGGCVYGYASDPAGTRFVMFATVSTTGSNVYVTDITSNTAYQLSIGTTATPGTVSDMAISADGSTLFWVEAAGVYSVDLTGPLVGMDLTRVLIAATDQPTGLYPLHDGSAVVYARDDEEQFKLVQADGSGSVYLTNPLGVGDLIGRSANSVRIASDDAHMLYDVSFTGVRQLNLVALGTPLGEARADSAATELLQTSFSFEFSPDGASYAWIGDDGVNGHQVFASTVGAPGTRATLTPAAEEPTRAIRWTDNATVAYVSDDTDLVTPIGASALRTVNTATPLTTLVMGVDETAGRFVDAVSICSDGTLVFDLRYDDVMGAHTALFQADPTAALSATRITPEIIAASDEIGQFTCVD